MAKARSEGDWLAGLSDAEWGEVTAAVAQRAWDDDPFAEGRVVAMRSSVLVRVFGRWVAFGEEAFEAAARHNRNARAALAKEQHREEKKAKGKAQGKKE